MSSMAFPSSKWWAQRRCPTKSSLMHQSGWSKLSGSNQIIFLQVIILAHKLLYKLKVSTIYSHLWFIREVSFLIYKQVFNSCFQRFLLNVSFGVWVWVLSANKSLWSCRQGSSEEKEKATHEHPISTLKQFYFHNSTFFVEQVRTVCISVSGICTVCIMDLDKFYFGMVVWLVLGSSHFQLILSQKLLVTLKVVISDTTHYFAIPNKIQSEFLVHLVHKLLACKSE